MKMNVSPDQFPMNGVLVQTTGDPVTSPPLWSQWSAVHNSKQGGHHLHVLQRPFLVLPDGSIEAFLEEIW